MFGQGEPGFPAEGVCVPGPDTIDRCGQSRASAVVEKTAGCCSLLGPKVPIRCYFLAARTVSFRARFLTKRIQHNHLIIASPQPVEVTVVGFIFCQISILMSFSSDFYGAGGGVSQFNGTALFSCRKS